MKKKFLMGIVSIVFAAMCLLSACDMSDVQQIIDNNTSKLQTPTGIYLDDNNILRWNSVENASSYIININEQEYERTTVACDLKKILKENGTYEVYIKATSKSLAVKDSDYSDAYRFEFTGGIVVSGNESTGLFSQFEDIYTKEAYIGYGYNVIDSSYINSEQVKKNFPIFDKEKLSVHRLAMIKERHSEDTFISGNSIKSYQNEVEAKFSSKIKAGNVFSGSIATKFSSTSDSTASALFYEYQHTTTCYQLFLQTDFEEYKYLLTDAFRRDVMKLDTGTLFERYGTHVLTSVTMGGRFNLTYTMISDKEIDTTKLSAGLDTSFKAWSLNSSTDVSAEITEKANTNDATVKTESIVYGGDEVQMNNEKSILANYQKWISTIEDKPALVGVCDVNSLVGIWDLLGDSDEEQIRKKELKEAFERYGSETYDNLLQRYNINPPVHPTSVDVEVKDRNGKDMDNNFIAAGSTLYLSLYIEPTIAVVSKSITSDKPEYTQINTVDNTVSINADTPDETKINITVDVGYDVQKTFSIYVYRLYTITFNSNGGTAVEKIENIRQGAKAEEPRAPEKMGKTFKGWYYYSDPVNLNGYTEFSFDDPITKNVTLYAEWNDYYPSIRFESDVSGGAPESTAVKYGECLQRPENPTLTGYDFVGFYANEDRTVPFDFSRPILTDTKIYVKWNKKEYTVTFETNGGTVVNQQTVLYKEKASRPICTKEGVELLGWYKDPSSGQFFDFHTEEITEDITLYARWSENVVCVRFNTSGGDLIDERRVSYGENLAGNMPVAQKEGYTFLNWYKEETLQNVVTEYTKFNDTNFIGISENRIVTLYAKYKPNTYEITLNANGGKCSIVSTKVQFGTSYGSGTAGSLPDIEKIGYSFDGWYTAESGGNIVEDETICVTASDHTLYARWIANEYEIIFDKNNTDLPIEADITLKGSTIPYDSTSILTVPAGKNVYFEVEGWYSDAACDASNKIADANGELLPDTCYTTRLKKWKNTAGVTLYAKWVKSQSATYVSQKSSSYSVSLSDISSTDKYLLIENVSFNGIWNPIGTFNGTLDGDGHTVSNLSAVGIDWHWFGFIQKNKGTIKNITFDRCSFMVAPKLYYQNETVYCGTVCGINEGGTIENVTVNNSNIIANSTNIAIIFKEKTGKDSELITQSGNIDLWRRWYAQSKLNNDKDIDDNWFKDFDYHIYAGGVVGWNNNGTLKNCSVKGGSVKANLYHLSATEYRKNYCIAGGVCGYNTGTIVDASSTAAVRSYADLGNNGNAGGWVGDVYPTAYIYACGIAGISTVTVSGSGNEGSTKFRHYAPQYVLFYGAGYDTATKSHADNIHTSNSATTVKI